MISKQQKNIKKTVWIIVAIMVTILSLFIHKITTPRYLSNIELKINGLILLSESDRQSVQWPDGVDASSWLLIVDNEEEQQLLQAALPVLDNSIKHQLVVKETKDMADIVDIPQPLQRKKGHIPIIKPGGRLIGYLVSPYDTNKVILTLSSVVTHR